MPAARPIWKGHIRLSLVSIPVELFTATKTTEKIAFRQIHEPTGKPIHYQKVVAGVGPVDTDEILQGLRIREGPLRPARPTRTSTRCGWRRKKTFDLDAVRRRLRDRAALFRQALFRRAAGRARRGRLPGRSATRCARAEMVGLGQLAMRGKEYLAALKPCGKGLLLETLHYEEEIRKADPYLRRDQQRRRPTRTCSRSPQELIKRKTAPFDAAAFKDHYTKALRELIDQRMKGKAPKVETGGRAAERRQRHRPDGGAEAEPRRRRRRGQGARKAPAKPRDIGASKAARRAAQGRAAPRRQARRASPPRRRRANRPEPWRAERPKPTASPNIAASAISPRRRSRPARSRAARAAASSCRSTPRRGSTTISASSSTAC